VTAAAKELNLTQGAVSRQIAGLEEQLDVRLFYREHQKIRLTPAGHAYVREIREGLKRIGSASMNLRANPAGGTLNLGVPPEYAAKWLIPRLPAFGRAHPDVTLNILSRETRVKFNSEPIDMAIYFSEEPWGDAEFVELRAHEVIPVCCVALKKEFDFKSAQDLRRAPLLHLTSLPDGWERFLSHYEAPASEVRGMLFDQLTTLAAAASAGLGVALLPGFLYDAELGRAELVPALDLSLRTAAAYRLSWPKDRSDYPPALVFRSWLLSQNEK
jgi:LysR family glycine cleavage system transcriptional activator